MHIIQATTAAAEVEPVQVLDARPLLPQQSRRWTTGAFTPHAPAPPPRRASTGSLRDTPSSRWRSRRYRLTSLTMTECIEQATAAALAAEAKAAAMRAQLILAYEDSENSDPQLRFVTERRRRKPLVAVALPQAPTEPTPEMKEDGAVPEHSVRTPDKMGARSMVDFITGATPELQPSSTPERMMLARLQLRPMEFNLVVPIGTSC